MACPGVTRIPRNDMPPEAGSFNGAGGGQTSPGCGATLAINGIVEVVFVFD